MLATSVVLEVRQEAGAVQRLRPNLSPDRGRLRQCAVEERSPFGDAAAPLPVAEKRARGSQRGLDVAHREQRLDRSGEVRMLRLDPVQPSLLLASLELGLSSFGEGEIVLRVAQPERVRLATAIELLRRELADELVHPVARAGVFVRAPQKALVEERGECLEVGVADRFGCLERAAADEDREPGEELLLLASEQVERPLDGRAQRLLARVGVAVAPEQVEALGEPFEQLLRREEPRTSGGKLDCEWEPVQTPAELLDRRARLGLRPLTEQRDAFLGWQRRQLVGRLAADPQQLA